MNFNKIFSINKIKTILCQTRYLSDLSSKSEKQLLIKQNLWLSHNRCETLYGKEFLSQRQYQDISYDLFSHLSSDKSLIETIINEYNYEKYSTQRVPSTLRPIDVKTLCQLKDFLRISYLNKLFKDELQKWFVDKHNTKNRIKVTNDRLRKLAELNADINGVFNSQNQLIYDFNHNCLTLQFNDLFLKKYLRHKLSFAQMFGNQLVIDCGFDNIIELFNLEFIIKFINKLVDYNCYKTRESFDLYFCNFSPKSDLFECLTQSDLNFTQKLFGFHFKTQSFTDLFPNKRLVYLTQYSDKVMDQFDNEVVYILPAITHDYAFEALVKAKREGLEVRRLPLNEFGFFSRNTSVEFLNCEEMIRILDQIRFDNNWSKAFSTHLKDNKIISFVDQIVEEDKKRIRKLKSIHLSKVKKNTVNSLRTMY